MAPILFRSPCFDSLAPTDATWYHLAAVTYLLVINTGSNDVFSPAWCHATTWTYADLSWIGSLAVEEQTSVNISYQETVLLKVLSAKLQPFCSGLNVLNHHFQAHPSQWVLFQYMISLRNLPQTEISLNLALPITHFLVIKSFWNFAHSTAVTLPCSVQNF